MQLPHLGVLDFKKILKDYIRINKQITSRELRVIDAEGESLGVMSKETALAQAEEAGLDLIEIAPNTTPPVAKIMDYGKYQYIEKQKLKQSKAKSHVTETKSIQVKIGTGDHDLQMKAERAGKFISEGHRVKIELFLPGRAKYLEKNFLSDRLSRLLKLIPGDFKMASEPQRGPKGLYVIIEKSSGKKPIKQHENEQII